MQQAYNNIIEEKDKPRMFFLSCLSYVTPIFIKFILYIIIHNEINENLKM